jgi:hypothetical protein
MRKKTTSNHSGKSLAVLLFFCGAVLILILLSLLVKIAAIVARSNFDGKHRYNVAVLGKPMHVISFAPDTKSISILEFSAMQNTSKNELSRMLHIPVDAYILEKNSVPVFSFENPKDDVESYMQHVFFSFPKLTTDLTLVDAFQLWMQSRSVEQQNVLTETFEKSLEEMEAGAIDKAANKLFFDSTMSNENKSIQIVNGTNFSGIGNDIAQMITNMGGNVVSVTTAHTDIAKTSLTYSFAPSYTVAKLEKMFGVKATRVQKQQIFDIIVIIGQDKLSLLKK